MRNQNDIISFHRRFSKSHDLLRRHPIDQRPLEVWCDLYEKVFNIPRAKWDILTYL